MVKLIYLIFFTINLPLFIVQAEELNKQERVYFNFIDLNNDKFISFDEINNNEKPINSAPIFRAIKSVYEIAVITPPHSKKSEDFILKKTSEICNKKIKSF